MTILLLKKKKDYQRNIKKKLYNLENINIKEKVNVKNICISGYIHLRNTREFNKEIHNNLKILRLTIKRL